LRVVFDENVPAAMVRIFGHFNNEKALQRYVKGIALHRAQEFYPHPNDPDYLPRNDAPWIRRYAKAGGRVIISGDAKMQTVPHERLALVQEGMTVVFFPGVWSGWKICRKSALLMHWWPSISSLVKKPIPGFFVVPNAWPDDENAALRQIATGDLRLERMERQLAEREKVRRVRVHRQRETAQGEFWPDETPKA